MTAQFTEHFDHHRGKLPLLRATSPPRTGIFMAVSFAGFVTINAFWAYISCGKWIDFQPASCWRDLVRPLGETFLFPLSVPSHKWMILVCGLSLAMMVLTPIVLSVLYRLIWSVPAVLIVAAVGHTPVLAITLAIGCLLAARTPLRSDVPFVAVLLGLLPPSLYLMLFSSIGSESAAMPVEQLLLKAPLLAAVVGAVLAGAAVLSLARITNYRSGVVWPVVTVLVAAPILVFFLLVGGDELEYNLMTADLSPTDTLLEPVSLDQWRQDHNGVPRRPWQELLPAVQVDLQSRKNAIVRECERFMDRHKRSDRDAAVLWVSAQAASLQIDPQALAGGQVRYDASYPSDESISSWAGLVDNYGPRPQAALAQWHLAELDLRSGRIALALEKLLRCDQKLHKLLDRRRENSPEPADVNAFAGSAIVPQRNYYQIAQARVQQLLWMIQRVHAVQDAPSAQALRDFLRLNPCQTDYARQLGTLAGLYDKTNMGDVLRLKLAMVDDDANRRLAVLAALASKAKSPAYVEANFELGELALDPHSPQPGIKPANYYFQAVVDAGPNPWKELAAQRLSALTAPNPEKTSTTEAQSSQRR